MDCTDPAKTIDYPDAAIDAQSVTVGGLLTSSRTKSGVTTTFGYDSLGRRTSVTDPRTGTVTTHYDSLGQVEWIEDAAHHRTSFGYDPATGRKISETNAQAKVTRFAYNDQGQVTHTWGDGPYPVAYSYDAYGRMATMTTSRTEAGVTAAAACINRAGLLRPRNSPRPREAISWWPSGQAHELLDGSDGAAFEQLSSKIVSQPWVLCRTAMVSPSATPITLAL